MLSQTFSIEYSLDVGRLLKQIKQPPQRRCPCACHEGIWRSGGIAPLILDLG